MLVLDMKYNANAASGGIEAIFTGTEVYAVREAFRENAERLETLGNHSSVSPYQKMVARWKGSVQTYRGPSYNALAEPLRHYVETTEDKVDHLLDNSPHTSRIQLAAKRYELGHCVELILEEIEQYHSGEAVSTD